MYSSKAQPESSSLCPGTPGRPGAFLTAAPVPLFGVVVVVAVVDVEVVVGLGAAPGALSTEVSNCGDIELCCIVVDVVA